jgi:hypothetical protein
MPQPTGAADAILLVDRLAAGDAREHDKQHDHDDEDEQQKFQIVIRHGRIRGKCGKRRSAGIIAQRRSPVHYKYPPPLEADRIDPS